MSSSRGQKDGTFSFLPMDLSGKLMIKARLGDDFRRVPIHNEDITYDELLLMLQRVYKGKLNNTDEVTLKYCDEEGDYITISDSSDLNLAKQICRQLKIKIYVHGKVPLPTLDASEVQEVRTELVTIRNKVNTLLNALDGASSKSGGTTNAIPVSSTPKAPDTIKQSAPSSNMSSVARTDDSNPKTAPTGSLGIFDPLKPTSSQPAAPATSQQSSTSQFFAQGSSTDFLTSQPPNQQSRYPPQMGPGQVTQQQTGQVNPSFYGDQQQQQQQQQQPGYSTGQQAYPPTQSGYPQSAPAPTPPTPSSQMHTPTQYPPNPATATPQPQAGYYYQNQPPRPSSAQQYAYRQQGYQ
ncbi:protein TFG-like isoform X1 [Halichondria panicea]|uniref:protein TFG-like isoform X1 n=1 Tax=Halichondria panicea TaxID=6063 RepID=UPI00312B33F9